MLRHVAKLQDARKELATKLITATLEARISRLESKLVLLFLGTYTAVPFASALVFKYLFHG